MRALYFAQMTCYIRLRAAAVAPDCGCFQSAMHGCSCLLPPSLRVAVPNPPTAPAPLELQECNSPIFVEHLPAWPNLQILLLRTVRPTAIGAQQLALLAAAPGLRRLAFNRWVGHFANSDEQEAAGCADLQRMEVRWEAP